MRVGFQFDVADGIKIAFEFSPSFLPAKETTGVLAKPEPNAVESIDDVYPAESVARVAPSVKFGSHRFSCLRKPGIEPKAIGTKQGDFQAPW